MEIGWETDKKRRFKAQKMIVRLVDYLLGPNNWIKTNFDPATPEEYGRLWGERKNFDAKEGVYERDSVIDRIPIPGSTGLVKIVFANTEFSASKVSPAIMKPIFAALFGDPQTQEIRPNSKDVIIIISRVKLDGIPRNNLMEYSSMMETPIRHFMIDDLQYDPTMHMTQPKIIRLATEQEVRNLINNQIGLKVNNFTVGLDFEAELDRQPTDVDKLRYIQEVDEKILQLIPTINTEDPIVKWRWFKAGQVIAIYRKGNRNGLVYRRVITVEFIPEKPPKIKAVMTNK